MSLSDKLISDFAKIMNEKPKDIKTTHNLYGTVTRVTEDNTVYVKIDGSEIETPASSSVTTLIGNRVSVMINGHSAMVTGNISDPSASKTTTDAISSVATEAKSKAENAELAAEDASNAAAAADTKAINASNAAAAADTAAQAASYAASLADEKAIAAQSAAADADEKARNASSAADAAKKVATNYIVQNDNGITLGNASDGTMKGGQVNLNANGMSIINGQGNEVANYSNTTRIGFQSGHNVKIYNDSVDICSGGQVDSTFGSTTRIGVSDGHNVKIDNDSIDICSGNQVDATFGSESIILRDKYGKEAVKLSVSGLVKQLEEDGRIIYTTSSSRIPFPREETISPSINVTSGYYLVRNTNVSSLTGETKHSYIIELNNSYSDVHTINYYGPIKSNVKVIESSTEHNVKYFDVDENCDSVFDIKGLAKIDCKVLNPNTHGNISNGLVIGEDDSEQIVITPGWMFSRSYDGSAYTPSDLFINPSGGRVSFGGLNTYIDKDNNIDYIQTEALRIGTDDDKEFVGKIDYTYVILDSGKRNNNLHINIDEAKLTMAEGSDSLVVETNKSNVECLSPIHFYKKLTINNTSVFKPSGATTSNILACYNSGSSFSASNTFWTSGSFRRTYDSSSATEKYTHYIDFILPISKYITCEEASILTLGTITLRGFADSGSIAAASQAITYPLTGYNVASTCSISSGRNSLQIEITVKGNTKFNLLPGMPISIQWIGYTINFT